MIIRLDKDWLIKYFIDDKRALNVFDRLVNRSAFYSSFKHKRSRYFILFYFSWAWTFLDLDNSLCDFFSIYFWT